MNVMTKKGHVLSRRGERAGRMGGRGNSRGDGREAAARGDAERAGSAEGVVGRVKAYNAGIRWGGGGAGTEP